MGASGAPYARIISPNGSPGQEKFGIKDRPRDTGGLTNGEMPPK